MTTCIYHQDFYYNCPGLWRVDKMDLDGQVGLGYYTYSLTLWVTHDPTS